MKLAIVHGELVEQRAEELGDEKDEVEHPTKQVGHKEQEAEQIREPSDEFFRPRQSQ